MRNSIANLLFAAAALTLVSHTADAADLPLKNPPLLAPVPYASNVQWFFGVGTEAGVAQSSVSGTNVFATSLVGGSLTADGAGVSIDVGAIGTTNNIWWKIQGDLAYQNITAGTSAGGGASVASRWSATQHFDVGANVFQTIIAALGPNTNINFPSFTPVLPPNIAVAAAPQQYVGFVSKEVGVNGTIGAASGQTWMWEPGIESGFVWKTLGSDGKPNGGMLDMGAQVDFPIKGVTFNNVFAANGAPVTLGPHLDLGTQYLMYVKYNFSVTGR